MRGLASEGFPRTIAILGIIPCANAARSEFPANMETDFRLRSGRRHAALRLVALALAWAALPRRGRAQSTAQEQQPDLDREVAKRLPGITARPGRVTIEVPEVADNGNTVPCTISVDSPMTEADHVRAIYVWAARNPRPFVIEARFGPYNPRARLQTRLRLGDSERLLAIAELSDGTYWAGVADIQVQVSACEDGSG
jgi:sulfur-oxidizing protein SoxY